MDDAGLGLAGGDDDDRDALAMRDDSQMRGRVDGRLEHGDRGSHATLPGAATQPQDGRADPIPVDLFEDRRLPRVQLELQHVAREADDPGAHGSSSR